MVAIGVLPDDLLREIVGHLLVPLTFFHTLYCQLALVSRQWRTLFLSNAHDFPVVALLREHYFHPLFPWAHTADVLTSVQLDWPRLCNNLMRLDCTNGPRCIGFSCLVRYSLCATLIDLARMGVDTLSQRDLFNVCRSLHRTRYLHGKVRASDIRSFPSHDTPLNRLYMCLPYDKCTMIYLGLWDLRDRLRGGGGKLDASTIYGALTLGGKPLLQANHHRRTSSPIPASHWSLRTFHSLSKGERVEFLARHATRIERNLFNPAKISHLLVCETTLRQFEQNLDVLSPLYEEDMRLMRTLLLSLRDRLIESKAIRASEVTSCIDKMCSVCINP